MSFFLQGLHQAWHLITSGSSSIWQPTWITLKVAFVATLLAVVVGLPFGLLLGLSRSRTRAVALAIANAGLALPPVVVGLVLSLLMFPRAPLGRTHLLFTLHGVYVAQAVLALPIVTALSAAAVRAVPVGLLDQARAFGAGTHQVWALAAREARVGILAAVIAAVGSALSEVGAVVLVGANIEGVDQTLASAALERVDAGRYAEAMGISIILMGLIVIVIAALTVIQYRGSDDRNPGPRAIRPLRIPRPS